LRERRGNAKEGKGREGRENGGKVFSLFES